MKRNDWWLILCFVVCRLLQMPTISLFDDAFITFRYAQNLANGNGFVYNIGEYHLGLTGPLWGLITSMFFWFPFPLILVVLLNILIATGTLILIRKTLSNNTFHFSFFVLIFATLPYFIRINLGGMESDFFVFLVFLTFFLLRRGLLLWALPLAFVSYFVRPEAVLLIVISVAYSLMRFKRRAIYPASIGLFIMVTGLFWIKSIYGSFLPQSVIAKQDLSQPFLEVVISIFAREPIQVLLLPFAAIGIFFRWKDKNFTLFHLFALFYLSAFLFKSQKIWTWYIYPVLFLLADLSAITLSHYFLKIAHKLTKKLRVLLPSLVIITVVSFSLLLRQKYLPNPVEEYVYQPIAEFWNENKRSVSIFADDIGIIGFASRAYIYDSESLINPLASSYENKLDIIRDKQPDYIFIHMTKYLHHYFEENGIYDSYQPIRRFAKNGELSTNISELSFDNEWAQDYFLFIRK